MELLLASLFHAAMPKQEPVPVGRARFVSLGGKAVLSDFTFPYPTYKSLG